VPRERPAASGTVKIETHAVIDHPEEQEQGRGQVVLELDASITAPVEQVTEPEAFQAATAPVPGTR
jgi:hypothetical protein